MAHPQTPQEHADQLSRALGRTVTVDEIGIGFYRDRINRLVRSVAARRNQRITHAWTALYCYAGVELGTRAIELLAEKGRLVELWEHAEKWAR